ncbi:T7SS effector LXG polymorphic toxin [Listeria seeligeri]|uniref:T7SS effector LXG polymorphic toxin n=1 Tax=Listeria seeligeri TaxID=1640 RepID=UPI001628A9F9|nr:T7SS effector LXG polymorphic toxin [Listeria seeligeri]MBC1753426.1 hypothetical protein [Listeria seeligeri]MBC1786973.1 hypothetical protein [Listeria seeligeri]MBC1823683.1 hypothetical protein [Listeria seeligeri]MBC1837457.1 hypothetical protein [Listeria seeligeri]MBC2233906.1 hypothetical protein [Listeria seeligeri]
MTKIWDTTKYDNFHSGIKKYTKNTIKDLKKVSKKQQEFSTNNKGTKSKTFDGAKAYMGEVHPSIVTSINRALDEYMRVVDKLESDFEDSVDSAGNVKIDTDMINQLNKDTDRKVEDVYQAHAELQKQIDICNTDSNTMPIVAPLFGPLETNMNTINTHLIKVKDSMDDYDMSHNNALNSYHQLVEATRKAIDAAKTNYTAPNGAIKYSSGAFANSPEGEALSNANYQLEAAKLAELYEADKNKNLNNMRDYVNQLLQDPDRLDREMASILNLLNTQDFNKDVNERAKWNSLYILLLSLKTQKEKYEGDTKDFRVMTLKLNENDWDKYNITGSYQTVSQNDWNNRMGIYKDQYGGDKRLIDFSIKHYGNEYTIAGDMGDDVVKDLNKKIENNNANWAIPLVSLAIGFLPVVGTPLSVIGTAGDVAQTASEDEEINEKIKMENLKSTADTFKMTISIQTIHREPMEDMVSIDIQPTQETRNILARWEEKSNESIGVEFGEGSFPKAEISSGKLDYVELYKIYQHANLRYIDEKYILEGGSK